MALVSPRRLMPHHTLACVAVVAVMSGCASSAPEQRLLALPTPALPASAAPTAGPGTRWLQLAAPGALRSCARLRPSRHTLSATSPWLSASCGPSGGFPGAMIRSR